MSDHVYLMMENVSLHEGIHSEGDYWHEYRFSIMLSNGDGESEKAGHLCVSKLNWGAAHRNHISLFDAFDVHSMETAHCYDVVFDEKGGIRKAFQDECYDLMEWLVNDFHFLESITVDERFRGRRLAARAMAAYLENFANSSDVVYLKAFPLQYDTSGKIEPITREFKGDFKTCQEKLCKYYARVGFRRIGKTEHFFFVADDFLDETESAG